MVVKVVVIVVGKLVVIKPVKNGHSKRRPQMGLQAQLLLRAAHKYCSMLQENTEVVMYQ